MQSDTKTSDTRTVNPRLARTQFANSSHHHGWRAIRNRDVGPGTWDRQTESHQPWSGKPQLLSKANLVRHAEASSRRTLRCLSAITLLDRRPRLAHQCSTHVPNGSSRIALACLSRTDGPAPIYPERCTEPLPHLIARSTLHACPGQRSSPGQRCLDCRPRSVHQRSTHIPNGSSRIALACLSRTDGPAPIYPDRCPEPLSHPIARPTLHACPGQRCPERRCMPVPNGGPEWRCMPVPNGVACLSRMGCPEWRFRMAFLEWRFSNGRGMPVPDRGPGSWGSISCRNHRCSENVARKMNNPGESRGCPCISSSSLIPSSPVTKRLFPRTRTRLS